MTAEVLRGDPSKAIIASAERHQADLLVLGTHGKAGFEAVWAGSVAAKVIAHTRLPLLLVPVSEL